MSKFNRIYSLSVEVAGGQKVTIELPFTVEFEVRRELLSSSQTATIKIYNLGERLRDLIFKDRYNTTEFRAVQLRAGYEGIGAPLIFNGTVLQAYSYREGVDFYTVIEAYDGAYMMANSYSTQTFGNGPTYAQVMAGLNADLKGTTGQPIIGNFPGKSIRPLVCMGNTWDILVQLSEGYATIDNGQLKVLRPNEAITSTIPVISSESGLLGSPRRSGGLIEFAMLFEPRFTLAQIVALQSETNSLFNGTYKVMGFTHNATISPAVAGDARTDVSLWLGTEALTVVPGTPVQ